MKPWNLKIFELPTYKSYVHVIIISTKQIYHNSSQMITDQPFNPSEWLASNSPYNITLKSNIKPVGIKEKISN